MKNPVVLLAVFFVFGLFNFPPVYAASLDELTGSSTAALLRNGAKQTEIQFSNSALVLLPNHAEIRRVAENIKNELRPAVIAETLRVYRKPEGAAFWNQTEQRDLFNAAAALSTLEGLEYFSASRGTMRTFYEFSAVIDDPDTKRILPDPVYPVLPVQLTLYARQKDLTFGDNIYSYDYRSFSDSLVFIQQNLSPMSAGIIPAVGKNKLHSIMALIDTGDYLLMYAVSMAKVSFFPGMRDRMGASFSNRAEAVMNWVAIQADKVYENLEKSF